MAQNLEELTFYHGLEPHTVAVVPNSRPPLVRLNDVLAALQIPPSLPENGAMTYSINNRLLVLDVQRQRADYQRKSVAFPMRQRADGIFVRVDSMADVFSELLGRQIIYEPTSKSIHVPKSQDVSVALRTRKVEDGYRVILIYSQAIKAPQVETKGRALILKLKQEHLVWDRSGFQPSDAVTEYSIFEGLPDKSTEIMFRIGEKATKYQVEPYNPKNPRTVIKIFGSFEDEALKGNELTEAATGLRLIVIDPGHGGNDMGAIGPTGLKEKEVALEIGLILQSLLQANYGYGVDLTRRDDSFLSLKARTGLANNLKADLFLSIHVNAIKYPNARGSETYYLSLDGDGTFDHAHYEEFREEQEQSGPSDESDDDLNLILWDMAQTKHTEDSFRVARYIQQELNDLAGIHSRGVKQAPLKVLKGATMPAVLIETAFISNKLEEKRLKDRAFKERIAEAIARAIRQYDEDIQRRSRGKLRPQDRGN